MSTETINTFRNTEGETKTPRTAAESHPDYVREDSGLAPANLAAAEMHLKVNSPTDENYNWRSPFHAHRAAELSELGVGIHLYFTYLRDLALIMFGIIVCYLPQLVISGCGNMTTASKILDMNGIMISNIGFLETVPPELEQEQTAEIFVTRPVKLFRSFVDIRGVTTACGVLDFIAFVGVIVWLVWFLKVRTPQIVTENDEANHTMSDHTVMVSRLPKQLAEGNVHYAHRLREHFLAVIQHSPERHLHPGNDNLVVDVVVSRDHDGRIAELMKVAEDGHECKLMEARRKYGKDIKEEKLAKLKKEASDKFKTLLRNHEDTKTRDALCAFVTFNYAGDKDFVELVYGPSKWWFSAQQQPYHLRFERHCLKVQTAPEPEDILWQNLDYPKHKRAFNVFLIWCAVGLILMCSFCIIAIIKIWAKEEPLKASTLATKWQIYSDLEGFPTVWSICDVEIYSDFHCQDVMPFQEPFSPHDVFKHKPGGDTTGHCKDPNSFWTTEVVWNGVASLTFGNEGNEPKTIRCMKFTQGKIGNGGAQAIEIRACDSPDIANNSSPLACTIALTSPAQDGENEFVLSVWNESPPTDCDMTDTESLEEQSFIVMGEQEELPSAEWYIECYCVDNLLEGFMHWDSCKNSIMHYVKNQFISLMASGIVHIMNSVVKKLIREMIDFEHPWSNTQKMVLSLSKIFVAQYINTAWIVLLINVQWVDNPVMRGSKQITGSFAEPNAGWYDEVGNEFAVVSLLHIFFPHILKLVKLPITYLKRKIKGPKKVIQEDLNELYTNKEFKLDCKLAAVGAMVCFAFQYCAGNPVIIVFTLMAVVLIYFCDKIELLWACSRPPPYDYHVVFLGVSMLYVGIIGHTAFSCAFYGHPIVFPSFDFAGYGRAMVHLIAQGFEEEQEAMTYEYETEKGFFTSAFWPRTGAYVFSSASILQFILTCLIILITIFLLILGIIIVSGNPSSSVTKFAMYFFETKSAQFSEGEDFEHAKSILEGRKRSHSYRMGHIKDYVGVSNALVALDAYYETVDKQDVEHSLQNANANVMVDQLWEQLIDSRANNPLNQKTFDSSSETSENSQQ